MLTRQFRRVDFSPGAAQVLEALSTSDEDEAIMKGGRLWLAISELATSFDDDLEETAMPPYLPWMVTTTAYLVDTEEFLLICEASLTDIYVSAIIDKQAAVAEVTALWRWCIMPRSFGP